MYIIQAIPFLAAIYLTKVTMSLFSNAITATDDRSIPLEQP